jgi:glycosyltransferase involved in cell wall biosynthesis
MEKEIFRERRRAEFNIPNESFVFIYLGRINIDKGINELIQSFNQLTQENKNTHLILVGPIDIKQPTEKNRVENLIKDSINITRYEYTDSPERFLSMSDVLCCPSYREGFGTVVIEAAAMGITSIGSDVVGLKDSIINNQTGLLFRCGDSEDLREKMQLLMDNHELRKSLSENAVKNAMNRFSSSRLSNLVLDEYREKYDNK